MTSFYEIVIRNFSIYLFEAYHMRIFFLPTLYYFFPCHFIDNGLNDEKRNEDKRYVTKRKKNTIHNEQAHARPVFVFCMLMLYYEMDQGGLCIFFDFLLEAFRISPSVFFFCQLKKRTEYTHTHTKYKNKNKSYGQIT